MAYSAKLTRDEIYRNSKTWYAETNKGRGFNRDLIRFCQQRAGKKILDFGCATREYCLELKRLGFECIGVDISEEYIKIAQKKGIEAFTVKEHLPFDDNVFDTVIMFELLEHVENLNEIIREVKRVVKKNVLISVPNNTGFYELKQCGLTYEHMLELDHINFFTKESLSNFLSNYFEKYYVKEEKPIFVHGLLPWYIRKPLTLCIRLGVIKPLIYYALYAECFV